MVTPDKRHAHHNTMKRCLTCNTQIPEKYKYCLDCHDSWLRSQQKSDTNRIYRKGYEAGRKRRPGYEQQQFAHKLVRDALSYGYIKKLPCERCGSIKHVDAHHDDYSVPLNIRWLCRACHLEHHKLHG